MSASSFPDLLDVDGSKISPPFDDGAARGLLGRRVPDLALASTAGGEVTLVRRAGRTVVFAYSRTGRPGEPALVEDWDPFPGARGCTSQCCAFRDAHGALLSAGAARVFGLSTQDTAYQRAAVARLHLPFALLSDAGLALTRALALPTLAVADQTLLARLALVVDDGRIAKVFYPVFPPDRNARDVLAWLAEPRT